MRLGVRWPANASPHASLPSDLIPLVQPVESVLAREGDYWTLTWLEGRPRATLEDLVTVTTDAQGARVLEVSASVSASDLEGLRSSLDKERVRFAPDGTHEEDDEDDWL